MPSSKSTTNTIRQGRPPQRRRQAQGCPAAQWLALVSERRKLAHNFLLIGPDGQKLPADAELMLRDIGALAAGAVN